MRTGSTFDLQIQGARTGVTSKDEPVRSIGAGGTKRSTGAQLIGSERSGSHQQLSPYLSSLTYDVTGGGRRVISSGGTGKSLAAGASAAVQEAHQRLERLLGPQQQQTAGTAAGAVKRPISAPLTFGAPLGGTTTGSGTSGSTSFTPSASVATGMGGSTPGGVSRTRPVSATSLHSSIKSYPSTGPSATSSGGLSLLSTSSAAMALSSSATAAAISAQRVSSGRSVSAAEHSHGLVSSAGVTGVISSSPLGAAAAGAAAASVEGKIRAKSRTRSPTSNGRTCRDAATAAAAVMVLGEADRDAVTGADGALLEGSASMPTLVISSLDASTSSSGDVSPAAAAVVTPVVVMGPRRRASSNSLSSSSSEPKVLGSNRMSVTTTPTPSGRSGLRSATPPSSTTSPKSGGGSAAGSGPLSTGGTAKSHPRRRLSGGDTAGRNGGESVSALESSRTATTTTLKVGQMVDTALRGSGGAASGGGGGGGGLRASQGQRTTGEGGSTRAVVERHYQGPRSPSTSPTGATAAAAAVAGGKIGSVRSSSGGVGGSGKGTPAAGSGGSGKGASGGRRSSSAGIDTSGVGLVGEFILTPGAGPKASGGGSGAGGRPSSSERRRRSSSVGRAGGDTATASAATGVVAVAGTLGGGPGPSGVAPRDAGVRQVPATATSSVPGSWAGGLTVGASLSAAAAAAASGPSHRVKPPTIDLSVLASASGSFDSTPVGGSRLLYSEQPVGGAGVTRTVNTAAGGSRRSVVEFSGSLDTRLGPPLSPPPTGCSRTVGRFSTFGLDDSSATPPLLLLPTRSPLQSPRSSLGLPRRTRSLSACHSGSLLGGGEGGGLPPASRWACNPPLPAGVCDAVPGSMPPSAVVMHDLQAATHGLLLQVLAGGSSFIEALRERYVELYRARRRAQKEW